MEILTPIKAIRAKCLECCCGSFKEVKLCAVKKCTLWPYRLGHRPKGYTDTPEGDISENPQGSAGVFEEAEED